MKTYTEKLKDPRWQKKRLEIMERDGFKCRDCSSTDKTLHVHHCYYRKGSPWDTESKFILTLCEECHAIRQEVEDTSRELLGLLFAEGSEVQAQSLFNGLWYIRLARSRGLECNIIVKNKDA